MEYNSLENAFKWAMKSGPGMKMSIEASMFNDAWLGHVDTFIGQANNSPIMRSALCSNSTFDRCVHGWGLRMGRKGSGMIVYVSTIKECFHLRTRDCAAELLHHEPGLWSWTETPAVEVIFGMIFSGVIFYVVKRVESVCVLVVSHAG